MPLKSKNMKRAIFLSVLFCITLISNGQSDFREGFVINQNQDTIFGQIKYKEANSNYHYCQFKGLDSQDIISYKAGEILGYGFKNDKYFESKKIEAVDQTSETVLLEVLIRGMVTLYKYDKVFYIEKGSYGLLKLSNKTTTETAGGAVTETESRNYIGILSVLLSDCTEISSGITRTSYGEKSFTDLIEKYNKSMNSPVVIYKDKKPWVHARFGIAGGLINSGIVLEASTNLFDHLGPFGRSNSPLGGISFEILAPRFNEKISVHSDFLFSKSNYDSFNEEDMFGKNTKNYVTIDMTHLKIPIGLRYTFQGKKLSTFLNIGLSETFTLSSKSDWIQEVRYVTLFDTYQDKALVISKSEPGIWGGAGISKSIGKGLNLNLEIRFEKTDGINGEDFLAVTKSNVTSFHFLIGISTK